jgi:pimeloyl-ACP methyl ester carboxylesterase
MKKLSFLTRYLFLPVLFVLFLLGLVVLLSRWYLVKRFERETRLSRLHPQGIDELARVDLGGWPQWISVRGADRAAPLLLWLHDGPGGPSGMVFSRTFDQELTRHFVVVHWDQRGTGKSYQAGMTEKNLTLAQLRADLVELVKHLRERFKRNKLVLVGHAWGATLGLWYAQHHPQDLYAYLGISQILDWKAHLQEAYKETLQRAEKTQRKEPMDALKGIGMPPYKSLEKLQILRRWIAEFGGYYHRPPPFGKMLKASLGSPDYSLRELVRFNEGYAFSSTHLLPQAIEETRLGGERLGVPVLFVAGRYDLLTSGTQLQRYIKRLQAPFKALIWFEEAGYAPHQEQPAQFDQLIRERLLPLTRPQEPTSKSTSRP